jgi:uncharacterized membrane protein
MSIQISELSKELEIEERVRRVELWISNLLRGGVILSLALVVLGTLVSFVHHPEFLTDRPSLHRLTEPGAAFPHTLPDVIAGLAAFQGEAIVTVGLLFLIATPVMRVGISIFAFVYQHDKIYTFITAVVFSLLLLSFVLGRAE